MWAKLLAAVGPYIADIIFDKIIEWVQAMRKAKQARKRQEEIDKENREDYTGVEQGELTDEEDIRRTEDLLNGRRP